MDFQLLKLGQLRTWLVSSPVIDKFSFVFMTNDMIKIITEFEKVLESEQNWSEEMLRSFLVAACLLLLIHGPSAPPDNMMKLLFNVLVLMETQNSANVHGHVEYLQCELHKVDAAEDVNLLYLAYSFVCVKDHGLIIGICLMWSIVVHILEQDVAMHRFREFEELARSMGSQAAFTLTEMSNHDLFDLSLMLATINQIMTQVLLRKNNQLKHAGYPRHYIQIRRVDVDSLLSWSTSILKQVAANIPWPPQLSQLSPTQLETYAHVCEYLMGQIGKKAMTMQGTLNSIKYLRPELLLVKTLPPLLPLLLDTSSDSDD